MSESVIADFPASFLVEGHGHDGGDPTRGRVLLSNRRLVMASDEGKSTVPLSQVFDIGVGEVPEKAREFFDDTVTIGYRRNDRTHVAVVEAENDVVERFVTVLFKARLAGSTVLVRHPARVGGRVTDVGAVRATLSLDRDSITFESEGESVTITLADVIHFERRTRDVEGTSRQVLSVRHVVTGTVYTTQLTLSSADSLNVLGRYLRREYSELLAGVREIDLSTPDKEVLVALYSGAESGHLAEMLDMEASQVSMVLNRLTEKGLIETGDGTALTGRGLLAVNDRVEEVNF